MSDIPDIYKQSSYTFRLPEELIASYPCQPRDEARLLVVNRKTGTLQEDVFHGIKKYLSSGDTLVVNETKVIPARLLGYKNTGAKVEILLLKQINNRTWEVLVKPARRLKSGAWIGFPNSEVTAQVTTELSLAGGRRIEFYNCDEWEHFLEICGHIPLPPYINRTDEPSDYKNYQTVYARTSGSVAAPTAGLHFTQSLLQDLQEQKVNLAAILLHVGLGTFKPVSCNDIRDHRMHKEYFEVHRRVADLLNQTRDRGYKVVGVGTTVARTLESIYDSERGYAVGLGETDKYIIPGCSMHSIDALITNFHLPGSSLLMLVSAFGGYDLVKEAYTFAIANKFRFYSYGDAMLII